MMMFTRLKNRPTEAILLVATFALVAITVIGLKALRFSPEVAGFSIAAACAVCVLLFLVVRRFCDPLTRLARHATDWEQPDSKADLEDCTRRDELGAVARGMARMRAIIAARNSEQANALGRLEQSLRRLSNGDLTAVLYAGFPEELEGLRVRFNRLIGVLNANLSGISANVASIAEAAQKGQAAAAETAERLRDIAPDAHQASTAIGVLARVARLRQRDAGEAADQSFRALSHLDEAQGSIMQAAGTLPAQQTMQKSMSSLANTAGDLAIHTHRLAAASREGRPVPAAELNDLADQWTEVARQMTAQAHRCDGDARMLQEALDTAQRRLKAAMSEITTTQDTVKRLGQHVDLELQRLSLADAAVVRLEAVLQALRANADARKTACLAIADATRHVGNRLSLFSPSAPAVTLNHATGNRPHLRSVK